MQLDQESLYRKPRTYWTHSKYSEVLFDHMRLLLCGCFRECQFPDGTQAGKLVSESTHVCFGFFFFYFNKVLRLKVSFLTQSRLTRSRNHSYHWKHLTITFTLSPVTRPGGSKRVLPVDGSLVWCVGAFWVPVVSCGNEC